MSATPQPTHLSATDLAERWHVTTGHLANLRTEGFGPRYVKLGARVVYRLADVEAYEAARLVTPARSLVAA